jgi:VanZ family protein
MMNRPRPRWAWLFFVQLALVVGASLLATTGRFPLAVFQRWPLDKLGHLFAYGGLSFLGVTFFGEARSTPVVGTLLCAAALEEVSQRLFQTRTFDLGDLAMNVVGISAFGAAAVVAANRRSRGDASIRIR